MVGLRGKRVVVVVAVVVVVVVVRRGSRPRAPSARNNKQAFSYSNKYQASGEHGGAADKEEARGERQTGGWLLCCYTEAYLGSQARLRRAKQAVKDL